MAMHFGKGYLKGGETKHAGAGMLDHEPEPEDQDGEEGGDHTAQIHAHLKKMHAATGEAHSHVEHHGDGSHTAHHIDEEGNVRGSEDTEDCPGGVCGGM